MSDTKTVKIISRISKKGNEYYQTALNDVEGEDKFIPVYKKKGLEKFEITSLTRKIDKRGVAYSVIEIPEKNIFFVRGSEDNEDEEERDPNKIYRAIITR